MTTATSPIVPVRQDLVGNGTIRYHAMDSLRAAMMLLGIVLHAGLSYTHMPRSPIWPFRDARSSVVCDAVMMASGLFRMPVFFMVAGFFAALIHQRRGGRGLLANRARRILVPLPLDDLDADPAGAAASSGPDQAGSRPGDHDGRDAGRV